VTATPLALPHPLDAIDQARADFYALLAALANAPRMSEDGEGELARAFNRLADASAAMDPEAATQEYTDLFIGVGKSEIDLHASHWRSGLAMEQPLVQLRTELAVLGLARREGVTMCEDHLSALCETMRLLVAGVDGGRPAAVETQRRFFVDYVGGWTPFCCNAIRASDIANYYRQVAEFCHCFMALERDALAMD
jgi:TorA maturation chaperone TorD